MSQELLKEALKGYDDQWTYPIWAAISKHAATLYGEADKHQMAVIAQELSQVSGGSGLDIIALLLRPDEFAKPELTEKLIGDVQWRLNRYKPGTEYPLSVDVENGGPLRSVDRRSGGV